MFKKKILSFIILAVFSLGLFAVVGGVNAETLKQTIQGEELDRVAGDVYDVTDASGTPTNTVQSIIAQVINAVLGLLGVIFLILIIYAGFLWMTAAGNDDQVGKAKNILTRSIIGVIIILSAYAISFFVLNALLT